MAALTAPPADPALSAYEAMAPVYDAFTSAYDYERWLGAIEQLAIAHGLQGSRVLDVACGTGKSFMPLLERGYEVSACDLSPEMVAGARAKSGGRADVQVADMRELPDFGEFDLLTCIDDSLNYMLSDEDLGRAFTSMARVLAPGGIAVFDCNTLHTYRTLFAQTFAYEQENIFFCWRGEASPELESGERAAATLEAFANGAESTWSRYSIRHLQRHHPLAVVRGLAAAAGLQVAGVRGQLPGVRLEPEVDEGRQTKFLCIARKTQGCR